jgi:hypothetical protein
MGGGKRQLAIGSQGFSSGVISEINGRGGMTGRLLF